MSQSRFSIVLVGVSALLRRPLVSRLRPADGERSPWVVFAARRCLRFGDGLPFRGRPLAGLVLPPSVSEMAAERLAFGLTASAFRHAPLRGCRWAGWFCRLPLRGCPRRVGLRAHDFRFRHAPLRGCPRRVGSSAFRFGNCRSAGWPSGSRLPLFGTHRFGVAARRVGLRAYCFGDCHLAGWPLGSPLRKFRSAGWPSGSLLPLFGTHRFGVAAGRVRSSAFRFGDCHLAGWSSGSLLPLFGTHRFGVALGGLAFGLTASAFRHVPLRGCRWAGWPSGSRLPLFGTYRFGDCRSAGWPSGSRLSLFGTHRSAPPYRRREGRRSTPTRHLFHFKTLISTC